MEKYYDTQAFIQLIGYFVRLGWYKGTHDLVTIRLQGGFEAFSGRATEDWEQQYVVTTAALPDLDIPSFTATGITLQQACSKVMRQIQESTKLKT